MLGYSEPSTIPTPNDTFSESCCRDLSKDALFGTDTLADVEQSSFDNRSCIGVCYLVSPKENPTEYGVAQPKIPMNQKGKWTLRVYLYLYTF